MIKKLKKRLQQWWSFNSPTALSWDAWRDFNARFKAEAPVRFFFSNTFPRLFDPVRWKIGRINAWVRARIIRWHMVDTGLEPGYYEVEELMVHSLFNLLKDFVEVEQAWMHYCVTEKTPGPTWRERWIPFYFYFFFRNREMGIEHLLWETDLDRVTPDRNQAEAEQGGGQARAAREVLELYLWWTDTRPHREDSIYPEELSKLDREEGDSWMSDRFLKTHPDEYKLFKTYMADKEACEAAWKQEDTEMLIRLIKVRDSLWT